ncbi:hypothetical protein BT93_H3617 [Corymbia citriodora subsp. variegata]|nr:hypothetical protein BT93_H3617 [Corymbia citriodora subsp. variegata]
MAVDRNVSDEPLLLPSGGQPRRASKLAKSLARGTLKLAMWTLFLAWITMFFVIPTEVGTDFYSDWEDATSGTLYGTQGSVLLLYSAPILLIAVLAVPYLLLSGGQEDDAIAEQKKSPGLRLRTFPVLVDGVFGVVSAAEFIGIAMFVAFVLWAVYWYTVVNFEMLPSYGDLTPLEKRVQMLQMSAYIFGLTALTCLAFLFLPVARGSILLRLVDIPFEHATRYHVWLGNLTMFLLTMHGLCYFIVWFIRGIVLESIIEWKSDGGANFAGVICYCFGFTMWVTTLPPVRKRFFELFFYTHQLYIIFVIFFALHVGDTYVSKAAGGIFLFMLDRFLRFWQSRRKVDVISATSFPCGSVSLVISKPKNLQYNALGFIFLQLRDISRLQWHPFSVSSSPLDGSHHLSVLIKSVGEWTGKLRNSVSDLLVSQTQLYGPNASIVASVEGPYGHESPYHLMYKKLILVAGGSGISPFLAILSDVLHRVRDDKPCLPRDILLIWAVKRSNEISLLSTIDMDSICPSFSDKVNVDIRVFVTRESEASLEEGKIEKVVSLNTRSRGGSMSVLVGTGNKIWSGAYVVISILGFLITLALLDACYLNPYSISKWWYRGILFVGCMFVSVIIFGGGVVYFWHRSENVTPAGEEDREESERIGYMLDQETTQYKLCENTSVSYGQRPDFKEILGSVSDSWGCVDVGVIVCGPQTLQSSVAKEIRSQDLRRKNNSPVFHFNSHSFDL